MLANNSCNCSELKSSRESKPSNLAKRAAKASFVGAKTVKGPSPDNVPMRSESAFSSAFTKAETRLPRMSVS